MVRARVRSHIFRPFFFGCRESYPSSHGRREQEKRTTYHPVRSFATFQCRVDGIFRDSSPRINSHRSRSDCAVAGFARGGKKRLFHPTPPVLPVCFREPLEITFRRWIGFPALPFPCEKEEEEKEQCITHTHPSGGRIRLLVLLLTRFAFASDRICCCCFVRTVPHCTDCLKTAMAAMMWTGGSVQQKERHGEEDLPADDGSCSLCSRLLGSFFFYRFGERLPYPWHNFYFEIHNGYHSIPLLTFRPPCLSARDGHRMLLSSS